ncbi:MAG: sulfurtransferase complex subunit TusB [Methanomassiliicoccales archaeon]
MLKSPGEYHSLDHMKKIASNSKKAAILFEDSVYFAIDKRRREELREIVDKVFVMRDDLLARGIDLGSDQAYEIIDYPRAVDLIMEEYDQTITV